MFKQLRSDSGRGGRSSHLRWSLKILGLILFLAPLAGWSQSLSRSGERSVEPMPTQAAVFAPNATITEGFDAGLDCPIGWTCINTTTPVGSQPNWIDGNPAVFPPQAGSGYLSASYLMAGGVTTISAWLISPPVDFVSGAELRFWSRAVANSGFADRLEIRSSSSGIDTGGTSTSVGDFTNLLGTINPTLSAAPGTCVVPAGAPNAGGYPFAWCEYSLTNANGLPLSGSGRIAFRYFVTDGGIGSSYADYIGIDTFSFADCTIDPVVTNGNDSGPGSLRQAIDDVCAGSTISFDPSLSGQTIVLASQLTILKDLDIVGNVPVTISGNDSVRVFNIANANVSLDRLNITNGFAGAEGRGGGILLIGGALQVSGSTIRDSVAFAGGGIYTLTQNASCAEAPRVTIRNSTISGNLATAGGGGGVNNLNGSTAIIDSTITNNSSIQNSGGTVDNGGGVYSFNDSITCTRIGNSIIAGNSNDDVVAEGTSQRYVSLGHNLIGTAGFRVDFALDFIEPGDQTNVANALLAPLGDYGGGFSTHALLPGSPAINLGASVAVADQRGIARPAQGAVDIGAFESRGFGMEYEAGDGQRAAPGQMFANPLEVFLFPIGAGEPVSGGIVTFTPPAAGASASLLPNPATIDANGIASSIATANAIVGGYNVFANANGAVGSVFIGLTNAAAELSIGDAMVTEGDAATSDAVFTVTRTNNLTAFSVAYSMTAGTAQEGSDYVATSGTLSFAAGGSLTQTINVPVVGDLIVEPVETATLNLGALTNTAGLTTITDGSGLLTITDNDSAVVSFDPLSVSQSEAITPMAFTVSLSNPVQSGVTLDLNSAFGTATAADFTPIVDGTVTFPANSNASQTVSVAVNNDALDENDETFALTLSGLTAVGNVTLGANVASGTIVDDDAMPVISITSPSQPEGNAGNTPMDFVVSLSAISGRDVSFTRATADGTATVADNDYLPLASGPNVIPAGELGTTLTVQIVGDILFEGDESFNLDLTNIVNATTGAPVIEGTLPSLGGTGTIEDDDQQATITRIDSDDPDASVVGQPYTVVVNVAAVTLSPLGTVTISDGSVSCGPVALVPDTAPDSSASCQLVSTSAGAKTLTATYAPASGAFAESSGTTAHQVNAASTGISVVGPTRSRINQPTTFTFALSVEMPGAGSPAGTVSLSSGAASCEVSVPTATPSCALTFDTLGIRTVSAAFVPSDGNFLGSSSSGSGNTQTLVFALSDLMVTKSNGVGTYVPGELIVYTVTVRNLGADAAAQIRVIDNVPAGLLDVVWSCDASGGVTCPGAGSSGNLDVVIASFPVGGLLNYTFYGNAGSGPAPLVNTALVELPADTTIEDPLPGNNSATDVDLLEFLFRNGFEDPIVNAPSGAYRLPSLALRAALDETARVVYRLDDANGEALRVYARIFDGEVQYALAGRGSNGQLRLGEWSSREGEPTLSWTARQVIGGWVLEGVAL